MFAGVCRRSLLTENSVGIFVGICWDLTERTTMLNIKKIEGFQPKEKAYKNSDSQGLFLFVSPSGAKLWRMAYRFAGKQKELSFGSYPEITLKEAREKRDDARRLIANGTDPGAVKQEAKRVAAAARPFAEWADEWLGKQEGSKKTMYNKINFVGYLKDEFGKCMVKDIKRGDVVIFLRKFEDQDKLETRDRVRSTGEYICAYADIDGNGYNPFRSDVGLKAQLVKKTTTSRAAITSVDDAATLFRTIARHRETGHFDDLVGLALRFVSLTAVRTNEIRHMEWSEIRTEPARWVIPAERMKMKKEHVVPLSRQALAILAKVREINGDRRFVFSCSRDKPISHSTLNRRLRDLGFNTETEHCGHGFRSTFSTLLNQETDKDGNKLWDGDVIELQLAHLDSSSVKAVYNRQGPMSLFVPRAKLLQHWADRIDIMVEGGKVISMVA
jgi:integrase